MVGVGPVLRAVVVEDAEGDTSNSDRRLSAEQNMKGQKFTRYTAGREKGVRDALGRRHSMNAKCSDECVQPGF